MHVRGKIPVGLGRATIASAFLLLGACTAAPRGGAALSSNSSDAQDSLKLEQVAVRLRDQGAFEAALKIFEKAAAIAPDRAEPRIGEGDALLALGSFGPAGEAYSAALRINSKQPAALRGLTLALIHNGQPELALDALRRLKEARPADVETYTLAGIDYDLIGDHKAAQQQYADGLKLVAGDSGLSIDLALSLALAGEFKSAIGVLRPLVDRGDATASLRQNLALVYGIEGDTDEARKLARIDLPDAAISNNIAYYQWLRTQPADVQSRALLGMETPAVPKVP